MLAKPLPGIMLDPLHPLSKGLVGFWLFNEGSGDLAYDISGYGNPGTLKNMLPNTQGSKWQGSRFGGGLAFDGTDDYVNIPDSNIWDLTGDYTITIWLKRASFDITVSEIAIGRMTSDSTWWHTPYSVAFEADVGDRDKPVFSIQQSAGAWECVYSNEAITDMNWHYIVGIKEGAYLRIYVDGTLRNSANVGTGDPYLTNTPLLIGAAYTSGSYGFFNGTIDEVGIYHRALSAEEIKQLYRDPFCNLLQVPAWQRYVSSAAVIGRSRGYIF